MAAVLTNYKFTVRGNDMKKLKEYDSYEANHVQTDMGVVCSPANEIDIVLTPLELSPIILTGSVFRNVLWPYKVGHVVRYLPPRGETVQSMMMKGGCVMSEEKDVGIIWFTDKDLELLDKEGCNYLLDVILNTNTEE